MVNAINNFNNTEHKVMSSLFTVTSDNAALMVALKDEMTSEYKVFGIISLSAAMNKNF